LSSHLCYLAHSVPEMVGGGKKNRSGAVLFSPINFNALFHCFCQGSVYETQYVAFSSRTRFAHATLQTPTCHVLVHVRSTGSELSLCTLVGIYFPTLGSNHRRKRAQNNILFEKRVAGLLRWQNGGVSTAGLDSRLLWLPVVNDPVAYP
jgi:hypothetical protein